MFSTLMVRVQTIAQPARAIARSARADGPPAARYYGENRSGNAGGSRGVVPPGPKRPGPLRDRAAS
jgi:hypothetical protein